MIMNVDRRQWIDRYVKAVLNLNDTNAPKYCTLILRQTTNCHIDPYQPTRPPLNQCDPFVHISRQGSSYIRMHEFTGLKEPTLYTYDIYTGWLRVNRNI